MNKRERQDMKELKNLERFDNSHSNWITRYKDILPIITIFVILIALFILYIVIGKVLFSSELLFLGIWIMVGLLSFLMSYYFKKTDFIRSYG